MRTQGLSRNRACECESGKKYKHCCGALSGPTDDYAGISDEELLGHVHAADDEGLAAAESPKQRAFQNVLRVLRCLNIDGVILVGRHAPPIVHRIHRANDLLFRPEDKQEGGIHLGAYMFRDIFSRLYVPLIFGSPQVDFSKLIDLSDYQKKSLDTDPVESARFLDQAVDLMDFGYGWMEFGHGRTIDPRASDLIFRSHVQLEAAAATATGAYDFRGTVQSALLGTELALKAGLAAHGISDKELRLKFGHDLAKAAQHLQSLEPVFDGGRVTRAVCAFPPYVSSRYAGAQPTRMEAGHILMSAQYVASEVTRRFSDRNLRADHPSMPERSYPQ